MCKNTHSCVAALATVISSRHSIPTSPRSILYYTILYYTILYYTILYYTIPGACRTSSSSTKCWRRAALISLSHYLSIYLSIYIYIYIERERERSYTQRERIYIERERPTKCHNVSYHSTLWYNTSYRVIRGS